MAVAARPGPSDARVPCPLCGGLIHPIAGKCKHCKADLTTYHAARPAANAPLPALFRAPDARRAVAPHPIDPAAAPPGAARIAYAPIATAREASQPVLPPRPTARAEAVTSSGWRSWPILVIIVATLAIVVAAVLMVWPDRSARDGKRTGQPPPAPERMDTQNPGDSAAPSRPQGANPPQRAAPPQGSSDPWGVDPPPAPATPDPSDDDADVDALADPFAAPRAPTRGRRKLAVNSRGIVMFAMADHLCRKMVQCGTDDPSMSKVCNSVATNAADLPANCPSAERCLQHIDAMVCSSQGDDLAQLSKLLTQFRDCAEAVRC